MLTSQYWCNHSRQEAPSVDRHVENGEEFLPLADLEVINKTSGDFFLSDFLQILFQISYLNTVITV